MSKTANLGSQNEVSVLGKRSRQFDELKSLGVSCGLDQAQLINYVEEALDDLRDCPGKSTLSEFVAKPQER
jgi:hypothetical protein